MENLNVYDYFCHCRVPRKEVNKGLGRLILIKQAIRDVDMIAEHLLSMSKMHKDLIYIAPTEKRTSPAHKRPRTHHLFI